MPPKSQAKKAGPEIKLIETEENAIALRNMFNRKAELIYGKDKTFNTIKQANKPFIVWLYGPPGSGKSSPATQKVIQEQLGLCTHNAVSISLDALVEGFEPFQRKSANVYRSDRTKEEKASLASSLYSQAWQSKLNDNKEKTLAQKRRDLFQKAVEYELDILYEFVTSGSKDDIKIEIFDILEKTGKLDTYNVFVVYPFVKAEVLAERLEKRPEKQMTSNTPFFRFISPKTSGLFIRNHIDYFVNYIMPRSKDITGEIPVVSAYIKYKLESGMTKEQIKEELSKSKDLTGLINKVIVFENKSNNKSLHNYSRKVKNLLINSNKKTNGGSSIISGLLSNRRKTFKKLCT